VALARVPPSIAHSLRQSGLSQHFLGETAYATVDDALSLIARLQGRSSSKAPTPTAYRPLPGLASTLEAPRRQVSVESPAPLFHSNGSTDGSYDGVRESDARQLRARKRVASDEIPQRLPDTNRHDPSAADGME
jgi:hypothetical protein